MREPVTVLVFRMGILLFVVASFFSSLGVLRSYIIILRRKYDYNYFNYKKILFIEREIIVLLHFLVLQMSLRIL
jgi:hypothetical protein